MPVLPSAPVNVIPSAPVSVMPSAPVSVIPSAPVSVIPSAPVSVIPDDRTKLIPAVAELTAKARRMIKQVNFFIEPELTFDPNRGRKQPLLQIYIKRINLGQI